MSEVQTRPAASRGGRGASRGGRGGFGSRSTRNRPAGAANGDAHAKHDDSLAALEDEGEIGQLKKLYGAKTSLIKEMFPDWSDVDILFALRETDGDENLTVTRIAEGTISQWDEVSKPKKERAKPKSKEATTTASDTASGNNARTARSGGAGPDKTRGRARAAERGGRSARGRSAQPTNGTRAEKTQLSVPTEESHAWDSNPKSDDATTRNHTHAPAAIESAPIPVSSTTTQTWASMVRKSTTVPKPIVKPKEASPAQKPVPETVEPLPSTSAPPAPAAPPTAEAEGGEAEEEVVEKAPVKETPVPEVAVPAIAVPDVAILPSKDQLTESNLERVADISNPPTTDTIRSEAADSWDTRTGLAGSGTPISAAHHQHQQPSKAVGSGYATTALKATDRTAVRTPSYSRRVLDQEEAVRMPGNRDVDRATVQFGALNFSGAADDDIDGDREEPETRAQPPDDSPVAHPRASLPPVAPPASVPDTFSSQNPVAPAPTANAPPPSSGPTAAPVTSIPQQPPVAANNVPAAQNAQQFARFGQPASQETPFGQKPYDAYGQPSQPSTNPQFDSFQTLPASSQPQTQQPPSAYSSAPGEYSQYYTAADAQNRIPFNYYNQTYGQQAAPGPQDGAQNQRSYGYPLGDSLSQYPQSNAARFGASANAATTADAQNSGNTTPNPPVPGQPQQQAAGGQAGQGQTHAQQQPQGSQYPYNHPYYASPYYAQYINQYGGFGQGNFGPYGKAGYGAHQPYGAPYDHNASQGSGFSAASLHRGGDSSALGASTGLNDYGRVGAGQQSGFGDAGFSRAGAGSFQSQAGQGFGGPQSQVSAQQAGSDELKGYGEAKGAGPSPSLGGARPGSAANTQSSQTGLPPPQSSQQGGVGIAGYGGYPSHLQAHSGLHSNQSLTGGGYGMGAGANQSHANNPYGGYGGHGGHGTHGGHGGQGYGGSYYGNQQRGWGGNYH